MPVPLRQRARVAWYLAKQRVRGVQRFPLVVELEPLFACNLACAGCGKIQYPAQILKQRMPVDRAVAAVEESGAPVVSIAEIPSGRRRRHRSRRDRASCLSGPWIGDRLAGDSRQPALADRSAHHISVRPGTCRAASARGRVHEGCGRRAARSRAAEGRILAVRVGEQPAPPQDGRDDPGRSCAARHLVCGSRE